MNESENIEQVTEKNSGAEDAVVQQENAVENVNSVAQENIPEEKKEDEKKSASSEENNSAAGNESEKNDAEPVNTEPAEENKTETSADSVKETEADKKSEKKNKKQKKEKAPKEKKPKEKFDPNKNRTEFKTQIENFRGSGAPLFWTIVITFIVMVIACIAVFFASVHGAEQVMVPNVTGKKLEDALLEMQAKELYPKIQLKYSDVPGDDGTILEQNPGAGAIVKAYRRVSLTVSRGAIVDQVADYIGQKYDDVKMNLQTQFTGQKQLIILAEPVYKADLSDAGTILEQDPPAGTQIVDPVTVQLVVSRGQTFENTRRPVVRGKDVNGVLNVMANCKVVYDFTSHIAKAGEKPGTVITEDPFENEFVPNYSRINADFAFPERKAEDKIIYGLFTAQLADYPFDIPVRLDATDKEGNTKTIVTIRHTGKTLTIPYAVAPNTVLTLYVVGKEYSQLRVE